MGFMDFLKDIGESFGIQDERSALPSTKNTTRQSITNNSKSKPKYKDGKKRNTTRQSVGGEKLVIDPSTRRQATPDYLERLAREKAEAESAANDPLEELLSQLGQGYSGTMPGYDDTEAIAALDAALGNTLQGINGIRESTNANFKTSDANLESMHNAYRNDIQTSGDKSYNNIADTLVGSIDQNRDETVGKLTQVEDESQAKRAAMLKSLGIQEAAAAPDSTVMKDAAANVVTRSGIDESFAEGQRANNLSYNTGFANSVGAAGNERRSALQQQLLKANSTIDAQELDARSQYQNQRSAIAQQKAGSQNDLAGFEYGMYQDEQSGMRDMLDQMMKGQEDSEPVTTKGYAGLAQDLVNSGVDQNTASKTINAHAEVMSSPEYIKARQKGEDPTAYIVGQLQKRGIPVSVAMQYVTNYNNLGSTSGYAAMQ